MQESCPPYEDLPSYTDRHPLTFQIIKNVQNLDFDPESIILFRHIGSTRSQINVTIDNCHIIINGDSWVTVSNEFQKYIAKKFKITKFKQTRDKVIFFRHFLCSTFELVFIVQDIILF